MNEWLNVCVMYVCVQTKRMSVSCRQSARCSPIQKPIRQSNTHNIHIQPGKYREHQYGLSRKAICMPMSIWFWYSVLCVSRISFSLCLCADIFSKQNYRIWISMRMVLVYLVAFEIIIICEATTIAHRKVNVFNTAFMFMWLEHGMQHR